MSTTRLAALAGTLLMAACTTDFEPENDTSTTDTTDTTGDTTGDTTPDTTTDTTEDPGPDTTPPPCDIEGHENFFASAEGGVTEGQLLYISDSEGIGTGEPFHSLIIHFFYGYGDPLPLDRPGTRELAASEAEQNFASCGTCVYIRDDCNDEGVCNRFFFQTGGLLEVTSIGAPGALFAGSLTGVHLEEVEIDWGGTHESTPVPGGEGWCIEVYEFEQEIMPLP